MFNIITSVSVDKIYNNSDLTFGAIVKYKKWRFGRTYSEICYSIKEVSGFIEDRFTFDYRWYKLSNGKLVNLYWNYKLFIAKEYYKQDLILQDRLNLLNNFHKDHINKLDNQIKVFSL